MDWTREDVRYAVATAAAIVLVGVLAAGNFGLLPSPLPGVDQQPVDNVTVPLVAAGQPAGGGESAGRPNPDAAASALGGVIPPGPTTPEPDSTPVPADTTPPVTTFTTADGTIMVGLDGASVTGTVIDEGSGVASVVVTFDGLLGSSETVPATVSCDGLERRRCSWEASPPRLVDTYTVSVESTDRAGNVESPGPQPIDITIVTTQSDEGGDDGGDGGTNLLDGVVNQAKNLLGL